MKIKLSFLDWEKDCKSVYNTIENMALSSGDFHSGSTFDAEIELTPENEHEIKSAIAQGYTPCFWLSLP